ISVTYKQGTPLEANQQLLLAIIRQAWGDRPIFFASTTNIQYDMQLFPYVARQGLAFKLVTPQEGSQMLSMTPPGAQYNPVFGAYANVPAGERLLAQGGFMLRNLQDRSHWADDATRNIPIHYYYAFKAQAAAEELSGNRALAQRLNATAEKFDALSQR
ncbi:MAG: hypothetical protein JO306_06800, partial [Gemmatimonadetes bacterium]|nr:hypothetical protein [Gemmatimonadota bacterium]